MNESGKPYCLWKRGAVYYYRLKGEKTFHTTKQSNKRLAEIFANKVIAEGKPSKLTLATYAKHFYIWGKCQWIERQQAKGKNFSSTMAQARRSQLDTYILPEFGHLKLQDINAIKFENWLITLPLSNGTKNSILHTLKIVLREAKREGIIKFNPMSDAEPLANNYKERDALTDEDLKLLFPEDKERLIEIWGELYFAVLCWTMVTTGMRVGEVVALQWKYVKFDPGAILIVQAVKADNKVGKPKSNDVRSVILPQRSLSLLKLWRETTILPEDEDFVFHSMNPWKLNQPLNRSTVLDRFKKALERAGIAVEGRNLVVHSFRHTYNTKMRSVLPEESLQYMMGHKSRAMTDRYDQGNPEQRVASLLVNKNLINDAWKQI